ncbi:MAG: N-acetyltransferase [Gammaproteobacteria bacterium CG22_combo_CG10-13_8_21_14_all_40_8]|nr:MAG: N-acetyltransferase [Gammaproteobacteria bacterium CG22_combo_CG10-13_8_21_14_all_40_8]
MQSHTVEHQPQQSRFLVKLDSEEAVLQYELTNDTSVDFYRTYVPDSGRGQGIAEKLVRAGLAWAKEKGYKVEASCWYVKKFLHK